MNLSYIFIPLITVLVAGGGSWLTNQGLAVWYQQLQLPSIAPNGGVIGLVWTIIFILATISALLFWNQHSKQKNRQVIAGLFLANAILNLAWSYIFFVQHWLGWTIIEMTVLNLTTLTLIVLLWRKTRNSAVLLLPYLIWVSFATYLAYQIWLLN